ncbi:MAG: hypothetical protein JWM10_4114 [Myxococcaceae bacterium]|nr:hypothetical protein [Myxococcaceae bacterium]
MDGEFSAAPLVEWHEASRYERTGAHDVEAEVARLVEQSESVVHTIAFRLWADGRIPGGARW